MTSLHLRIPRKGQLLCFFVGGVEGEAFVICGSRLCGLFLTCPSGGAILSIDEAACATEFLGPYTIEEHTKRGNVVRVPRLNRVCSEHDVRLSEREEPNGE